MYEYLYKMGRYSEILLPVAGEILGNYAGTRWGKHTGIGGGAAGGIGKGLGEKLSKLMKYKKGGRVKKTGKAIVHKGEYVLPRGVKPTKSQMKKVAKRKSKKKKGGKRK